MSDKIQCVGCEGGIQPLSETEIQARLKTLEGWEYLADKKCLHKRYTFKNFLRVMSFVNAVAHMANQQKHHPDMAVGYDYCELNWQTHAVSGVTENDVICAELSSGLE